MPLIQCQDCGRDVSPSARQCVHCGRPWPGRQCNAMCGVMLAVIVSALVVGCVFFARVACAHRSQCRAAVERVEREAQELKGRAEREAQDLKSKVQQTVTPKDEAKPIEPKVEEPKKDE